MPRICLGWELPVPLIVSVMATGHEDFKKMVAALKGGMKLRLSSCNMSPAPTRISWG